jgi:hypothetical protein
MTSWNFVKALRRPLMLASAALVFHTGAAMAASGVGDAQSQARELLGGKAPTHTALPAVRAEGAGSLPRVDAQEQARRLILGSRSSGKTSATVRVADISGVVEQRLAPINAQALARHMILGRAADQL